MQTDPQIRTDELVEWLRAQLDEDQWWAREASRRYGSESPVAGVHWHWECGEHGQEMSLDPALDETLTCPVDEDCFQASLRSVEEFPTASVGPLPVFAVPYADEQPVTSAGHIVRHDPARVLAEVAAKRRIVDGLADADPYSGYITATFTAEDALRLLALPYADRPGYREEWRP